MAKAPAASCTVKIHFHGKGCTRNWKGSSISVCVWLWMYFFPPAMPNVIWEFPEHSSSVLQGGTALPTALGHNPAWSPLGGCTGAIGREQSHEGTLLVQLSGQESLCCLQLRLYGIQH